MPSRKGWVTGLPEELCVCAAAEVTRRRPAAPPERARYMASQASSRRRAPQAWQLCSGVACQARGGPWQARVGLDGAGRTAVSKNLKTYIMNYSRCGCRRTRSRPARYRRGYRRTRCTRRRPREHTRSPRAPREARGGLGAPSLPAPHVDQRPIPRREQRLRLVTQRDAPGRARGQQRGRARAQVHVPQPDGPVGSATGGDARCAEGDRDERAAVTEQGAHELGLRPGRPVQPPQPHRPVAAAAVKPAACSLPPAPRT